MSVSIPIYFVTPTDLNAHHSDSQPWWSMMNFQADPGTVCVVPDETGGLGKVLVGQPKTVDLWTLAALPGQLPPHTYHLAQTCPPEEATQLLLGWRLAQYAFRRYKGGDAPTWPTLSPPAGANTAYVDAAVTGTFLARDLVNTPAADMGPAQLEAAARALAEAHGAEFSVICGDDLLTQNYPLIHAVGRACVQPPRLLDFSWGEATATPVTLVGKGVCFDSGGLDIKPAKGMEKMKKDMGGAANVLGLAAMIMALQLPVRLRVLIPAVENSVAGNAVHPLDVVSSRRGTTVEIGNTDAEGRLVLADALWEAVSSSPAPALVIDFATLTGAARVALGTELPAFYTNQPELATALVAAADRTADPLWQLPLHQPYRAMLDSPVADISNISGTPYGGSVTAALFLQEFVQSHTPWLHVDLMAWNLRALPGRPVGGEAMGIRAMFELIRQRVA